MDELGCDNLWFQILSGILCSIIMVENGLTIYLIGTRKALRRTENSFLLSLSVADFGVGASIMVLVVSCRSFHLGNKLEVFTGNSLYISIGNLCALTFDRFVAITYPLRYPALMTSSRVAVLLFLAWTTPGLCALLSLIWTFHDKETIKIVLSVKLVLLAVVPFIFMLFACVHLALIVRKHERQIACQVAHGIGNCQSEDDDKNKPGYQHVPRNRNKSSRPRCTEISSIYLVGVLVISGLASWSVVALSSSCNQSIFQCGISRHTQTILSLHVSTLMVISYSAINPLLYALMRKKFRNELKKTFRCFS